MQQHRISFDHIPALSGKDVLYQLHPEKLSDFYAFAPTLEGFGEAIEKRKQFPVDRQLLAETFRKHYARLGATTAQQSAIDSLENEQTFTLITAHQPAILGGPAYYFYKIFSTIHLSRLLNKTYPSCRFVPVFINGSEDHDFDEVRSSAFFGKKLSWDTEQTGPVGRFTTSGLQDVIAQAESFLGSNVQAQQIVAWWQEAMQYAGNYNDFVFCWLNRFFGNEGLLILSMDDPALKRAFIPIMEKEIVEMASERWVKKTQEALASLQWKPQAFVRDVNLFYMEEQSRERISYVDGKYHFVSQKKTCSQYELLQMLHNTPEKFSPNVILRPLYQEFTLPNLAYIGGGGELAYWLERKSQFSHFSVFFPMLIRRNSVLLIPASLRKTLDKLELTTKDLFQPLETLINQFLERKSHGELHLDSERELLGILIEKMSGKARDIDPTLEALVLSEGTKMMKGIDTIEARLKKSVKQKEETSLTQIQNVKQKLFPAEGLQERHDNYIQFWINQTPEWQEQFIDLLNPLEKEFLVIDL